MGLAAEKLSYVPKEYSKYVLADRSSPQDNYDFDLNIVGYYEDYWATFFKGYEGSNNTAQYIQDSELNTTIAIWYNNNDIQALVEKLDEMEHLNTGVLVTLNLLELRTSDRGLDKVKVFRNYRNVCRGIHTFISIGKILRELVPNMPPADLETLINWYKEYNSDEQTFQIGTNFQEVYMAETGPYTDFPEYESVKSLANSCMQGHKYDFWSPHPAEAYNGGDLAIASTWSKGKLTARAVVYPDKKTHAPIYTTTRSAYNAIKAGLENLGYTIYPETYNQEALVGAKFKRIKTPETRHGHLMPYLDVSGNITMLDEDHFISVNDGTHRWGGGSANGLMIARIGSLTCSCGKKWLEEDDFTTYTFFGGEEERNCSGCYREYIYSIAGYNLHPTDPIMRVKYYSRYGDEWRDIHANDIANSVSVDWSLNLDETDNYQVGEDNRQWFKDSTIMTNLGRVSKRTAQEPIFQELFTITSAGNYTCRFLTLEGLKDFLAEGVERKKKERTESLGEWSTTTNTSIGSGRTKAGWFQEAAVELGFSRYFGDLSCSCNHCQRIARRADELETEAVMQEDLREIRRNEIRTRPLNVLRDDLDNSPSIPAIRTINSFPVSDTYMPTYSDTPATITNTYRRLPGGWQRLSNPTAIETATEYLRNYSGGSISGRERLNDE